MNLISTQREKMAGKGKMTKKGKGWESGASASQVLGSVSDHFHAWLDRARATDDPCGDLIDDLRHDRRIRLHAGKGFPWTFRRYRHFRRWLALQGACQDALAAAPHVWQRYQQWTRRRR